MAQELGYWDRFNNFASTKNMSAIGQDIQGGARQLASKFANVRAPKLSVANQRVPAIYDQKLALRQKGLSYVNPVLGAVATGTMIGKGIEMTAGGANDVMDKRYSRMTPQQKKVKDMTAEEYNTYVKGGYGKGLGYIPTEKEINKAVENEVKNNIAPTASKNTQKKVAKEIVKQASKPAVQAQVPVIDTTGAKVIDGAGGMNRHQNQIAAQQDDAREYNRSLRNADGSATGYEVPGILDGAQSNDYVEPTMVAPSQDDNFKSYLADKYGYLRNQGNGSGNDIFSMHAANQEAQEAKLADAKNNEAYMQWLANKSQQERN